MVKGMYFWHILHVLVVQHFSLAIGRNIMACHRCHFTCLQNSSAIFDINMSFQILWNFIHPVSISWSTTSIHLLTQSSDIVMWYRQKRQHWLISLVYYQHHLKEAVNRNYSHLKASIVLDCRLWVTQINKTLYKL